MSDNIYTYLEEKFNIKTDYQFKRDYIKYPLKHINELSGKPLELPYKEDVEYLYLELNMTRTNICKLLNISATTWKKMNKTLCIEKPKSKIHDNIVKTTIEKYGVENYAQTDDWHKIILKQNNGLYPTQTEEFKEKSKKTKLQRYNDRYYVNKEKQKQTNLKKYGVEYYSQTNNFKEYMIEYNKEKYGCDWYQQSEDFLIKSKLTKLNKYGSETYNNRKKSEQTTLERYGVSVPSRIGYKCNYEIIDDKELLIKYIKDNDVRYVKELSKQMNMSLTSLNHWINKYEIRDMFDYYGSDAEREIRMFINEQYETINNSRKIIPPYELDIYIPKLNKAIEYNGNYWHNYDLFPKKKERDELKKQICKEKGIDMITIWEKDWLNNKDEIKQYLLKWMNFEDIPD